MHAEIITLLPAHADPAAAGRDGAAERTSELLAGAGLRVVSRRSLVLASGILERALAEAVAVAEMVVLLNGAGSAGEKAARKALAQVSGRGLVLKEEVLGRLGPEAGRDPSRALLPRDARWLEPRPGGRPGIWMEVGAARIAVFPDHPGEAEYLWERSPGPALVGPGAPRSVQTRTVVMYASRADRVVRSLERRLGPMGGRVLRQGCLVRVSVYARGRDPERAAEALARACRAAAETPGAELLWEEEQGRPAPTLHGRVASMLLERGTTLAVAESCTGGLIACLLVEVPGISAVLDRAVVTYSNASKEDLLDVPGEVLAAHGAVSRPAARAMAVGVRRRSGTDLGVAVTGIAGPSGGTPDKPVGTVFVAVDGPGGCEITRHLFSGDRAAVRLQSAQTALYRLGRYVGAW